MFEIYMPNLDPWINRSSTAGSGKNKIQNDNDNNDDDKYIEEKDLFEDDVDVFYNEDIDDDESREKS